MKLWNKTRLVFQFGIIGLVVYTVLLSRDPEAYCPFGGMLSIGSRFINGAASCQMSEHQMFLGIGMLAGLFFIGKLFCSYVCPIGTVTEWLGRIGKKFKIQVSKVPNILDRGLRGLKYAILFPVLYFTFNSNELFCKKFDPYFAATTGFNMDVELWWAIAAIALTIIGSIFINQFWCKYLCPLGAMSNVFLNTVLGGGALFIFILLQLFGIDISILWLILVWLVGGILIEILTRKNYLTPLIKITRDDESCTNCRLCDKACPYNINVSEMEKVNHLDCTMCVDCIDSCPVPNTLQIRKKNWKFLPVMATIVIVVLSLGFASNYELSTISEKWNIDDPNLQLSTYESVIKSVKCYGSAMSLVRRIKPSEGIHGMDAYARSHKVVVYYDESKLDVSDVKKTLFSPYKSKVRNFSEDPAPAQIGVAFFGVMNINDLIDNVNLVRALQKNEFIYGMETYFGEPVRVLIYYHPENVTPDEIVELIEVEEINYQLQGKEYTAELNFEVELGPEALTPIETDLYLSHIFKSHDQKFNKFSQFEEENLQVMELGMPEAEHLMKRRYIPYLVSHISNNDGIVRFRTEFTDKPVAYVYFDPQQTDSSAVLEILNAPEMTVTFSSGEKKNYPKMFTFDKAVSLMSVSEISAREERLQDRLSYLARFTD